MLAQLKTVAAERNALLKPASDEMPSPPAMLVQLKGIGPETAAVLWSEGLFRQFDNRRQVAAYAGLAPTPWQSGSIDHEQGISPPAREAVKRIMDLGGFKTLQEALRRAIGDELFLMQQQREGWAVTLHKERDRREFLWPSPFN